MHSNTLKEYRVQALTMFFFAVFSFLFFTGGNALAADQICLAYGPGTGCTTSTGVAGTCDAMNNCVSGTTGNPPGGTTGPVVSLLNPLKSTSITDFLIKIIDILLVFALPIIILFIMYSGFLFVTARGNESQITTAKSAFTWAVIGGVVILGAKLIITLIQGTVQAL